MVVLACLEDYFKANVEKLTKAKQDRLVRDPEPIRLLGNRTLDEIREMTARRLAHLYDTAEVEVDPANELYPFRDDHLARLNNMRSRDALDFLRRHHQHCITAGRWEEPEDSVPRRRLRRRKIDLDALWNDFHTAFQATVPDGEEELAGVLADAIGAASAELPDGFHFECARQTGDTWKSRPTSRTTASTNCSSAVCNAGTRGVAFGKQISELEKRAGEIPVAIVRTTDFPKTGKAATQIAGMLKRHGRTVVVADADWRRMLAFEAFRKEHATRPDFAAWQKAARPLGELDSLQKILKLSALASQPRARGRPTRRRLLHQRRRTRLDLRLAGPVRLRRHRERGRHSSSAAPSASRRPRSPSSRTSSSNMRRSSAGRAAARRRRR